MSNTTKLVASLAIVAFIFLLSAIIAHFMNGAPKHLDTVLALSAGLFGMIGSIVGFVYSNDNPWINK
jgi:hypothetical protein